MHARHLKFDRVAAGRQQSFKTIRATFSYSVGATPVQLGVVKKVVAVDGGLWRHSVRLLHPCRDCFKRVGFDGEDRLFSADVEPHHPCVANHAIEVPFADDFGREAHGSSEPSGSQAETAGEYRRRSAITLLSCSLGIVWRPDIHPTISGSSSSSSRSN